MDSDVKKAKKEKDEEHFSIANRKQMPNTTKTENKKMQLRDVVNVDIDRPVHLGFRPWATTTTSTGHGLWRNFKLKAHVPIQIFSIRLA